MKKEKTKILKEKYAGSYKGTRNEGEAKLEKAKDPKEKFKRADKLPLEVSKRSDKPTPPPPPKKGDQPNLFGEQDQVYNTIQEEISIIVAAIVAGQEAISKKEDQIADLMERKQKLEKAAVTVAKLRDSKLEKKKEKKKGK